MFFNIHILLSYTATISQPPSGLADCTFSNVRPVYCWTYPFIGSECGTRQARSPHLRFFPPVFYLIRQTYLAPANGTLGRTGGVKTVL